MTAGFLDGSCGGLVYACCRRNKESAKASSDYSLVDAAREQTQLLTTDSYPDETTNENRKFLERGKLQKKIRKKEFSLPHALFSVFFQLHSHTL